MENECLENLHFRDVLVGVEEEEARLSWMFDVMSGVLDSGRQPASQSGTASSFCVLPHHPSLDNPARVVQVAAKPPKICGLFGSHPTLPPSLPPPSLSNPPPLIPLPLVPYQFLIPSLPLLPPTHPPTHTHTHAHTQMSWIDSHLMVCGYLLAGLSTIFHSTSWGVSSTSTTTSLPSCSASCWQVVPYMHTC